MFSKKSIVVTIGNNGYIIAVHDGPKIESKVFLKKDNFNESSYKKISEFFKKHSQLNVFVLIDSIDQTYKKKSFPFVRGSDLKKLVLRSMSNEVDKDSLKNFLVINKRTVKNLPKEDRKWDCLFITSPLSEDIKNWINFLIDMPNFLSGVYMLPIESFNFLKLIKATALPKEEKTKKPTKNKLYCIIMHSKVSGTRQIVFSQDTIVFTRVVNYDFNSKDFAEKYEQDVYGTFEYLKRIYNDLQIHEIKVVNIFAESINNKILKSVGDELDYYYFTPQNIANKVGFPDIISSKSKSCDLLVSKIFHVKSKIMKFKTPKLKYMDRFFITLQSSYYLNLFLALSISASILYTIYLKQNYGNKIESEKIAEFKASNIVKFLKISSLKDENQSKKDINLSFERITDFGKLEERFNPITPNLFLMYKRLKYARDNNLEIIEFSYQLQDFKYKLPKEVPYSFKINGKIINESGDIEDLFNKFDNFEVKTKEVFADKKVTLTSLPKDIDFNEEYYDFPVNFTITNKK